MENGDNGNDKQSDADDDEHCDDDIKNDVNSAENSYHFTGLDPSTDLLTKQFEKPLKCRRSNILVEDGIQESSRFCQRKLQN